MYYFNQLQLLEGYVGRGRCKQLYGHQNEYNVICNCNPLKHGFHTRSIQNFSSSHKVPLRV